MGLGLMALIAALAAIGIVLVLSYITVSSLVERLKNSHQDFFKATIKKNYETMGVEVIDIDVKDIFGNTIANESYASIDGISTSLYSGREINKYSS